MPETKQDSSPSFVSATKTLDSQSSVGSRPILETAHEKQQQSQPPSQSQLQQKPAQKLPPAPTNPSFSESFRTRLDEIRKVIDEDKNRRRVLTLCHQTEPTSFDEYSSSGSFRNLEKFESSTYSEVLRAVNVTDHNRPVVMKIMRALSKGVIKLLPSAATRGCQSYNDILNELVVTKSLSKLHGGVSPSSSGAGAAAASTTTAQEAAAPPPEPSMSQAPTVAQKRAPGGVYKTQFFCLIHEIKVVSGNLERTLLRSKNQTLPKTITSGAVHKSPSDSASGLEPANRSAPGGTKQVAADTAATTGVNSVENQSPVADEDLEPVQQAAQEAAQAASAERRKQKQADDEIKSLPEEDRMLMEALPYEYVVTVMRHDGQPLWLMMKREKLSAQQLVSVLVQVIVGLAVAEKVYEYEHRDLHVSNILIKKTSKSRIPYVLDGHRYSVISNGIKATIIDATFSRLMYEGQVYYRDLTSTLRAYASEKQPTRMSLQNRSYRQMVNVTKNHWEKFIPKTNLIWLTYLSETLMKNSVIRKDKNLLQEIRKIRDYTLKVDSALELLGCFPQVKDEKNNNHKHNSSPLKNASTATTDKRVNAATLRSPLRQLDSSLTNLDTAQATKRMTSTTGLGRKEEPVRTSATEANRASSKPQFVYKLPPVAPSSENGTSPEIGKSRPELATESVQAPSLGAIPAENEPPPASQRAPPAAGAAKKATD